MLKWTLLIFGCSIFFACKQPQHRIAFTIDGELIDTTECNMLIKLNRAKIIDYFQKEYHAKYNRDFWTSSFNGETALQRLKDTVQRQATTIMVKRILAREMGIIANVGYENILNSWNKENKRREEALQNHQSIYGVKSFDMLQFYVYYMSYLENAIKDKMLQTLNTSDEAQLKNIYDKYKNPMFSKKGKTKFEKNTCESFEQIKELVKRMYVENMYQKKVTEMAGKARVIIMNGDVYENVSK